MKLLSASGEIRKRRTGSGICAAAGSALILSEYNYYNLNVSQRTLMDLLSGPYR